MSRMALMELWAEMRKVTEQILSLSVEDEEFEEKLEQLQQRQNELRDAIDLAAKQTKTNDFAHRRLVEECMQLEREIQTKFTAYYTEISAEIRQLQNATKARTYYQKVYSQYDGYFIDKHN